MTEECLRHLSVADIHQLSVYESAGGYATWRALLSGK